MSGAACPVMCVAGIQGRPSHAAAGANTDERLGAANEVNSPVPVEAAPGRTFQALSAGRWHTCAIDELGWASCWGELGFHGDFLCCSFDISIPCA